MIRVKLPGGNVAAQQLRAIADVLERHVDHDVVHITTRQDIQIHHVPLADIPASLNHLAESGLTTREACNNTVRNVTACPLSGVCPRERTDITAHMDGAVRHFLRHPLTQHLPRKFKISFSACESDCAQGLLHDLAVVAVKKDGRYGFKILAGGGLGHKPRHAITVEEFIEEDEMLASMEAIISLHNRYSNRKMRAKSRIKFLVDKFGAEGFVEKYREELQRTLVALKGKGPKGEWRDGEPVPGVDNPGAPRKVLAQKQAGLNIFPISVPIGDITAPQLRSLADLMETEGLTDMRTTQDQNLILLNVPNDRITKVRAAVAAAGLGEPKVGDDVVACPGTSTCRLGITSSKTIGTRLTGGPHDLRIRASGCHNGCAQPETGDIGIYGEGKRLHGKLVPHYQMYFGGDGRQQGAIGLKGPTIPAVRIVQAVTRVQDSFNNEHETGESFFKWTHRKGVDYFKELLTDIAAVAPEEVSVVLNDIGQQADFKVEQFGGGECAGAAQETVAANFAEAANERNYRNAFLMQRKYEESIECATQICRLVSESLLFVAGQKPGEDLNATTALLIQTFPEQRDLGQDLSGFVELLNKLREEFDEGAYRKLNDELDAWTLRAGDICQNYDRMLDLSASLITIVRAKPTAASAGVVDLSSYECPLHYIKARSTLRDAQKGEVVNFLFGSGEPAQQARSSLQNDGHEILAVEEQGATIKISVRK
jgi:sulfite reductase (NADPH) hemoprotein beta-component